MDLDLDLDWMRGMAFYYGLINSQANFEFQPNLAEMS